MRSPSTTRDMSRRSYPSMWASAFISYCQWPSAGRAYSPSADTVVDTFAPGHQRSRANQGGRWIRSSESDRTSAVTRDTRPPQLEILAGEADGHLRAVSGTASANGLTGGSAVRAADCRIICV